jgi:hypothetical protein
MSSQTCPTTKLEKLLLATDGSVYSEGTIRETLSLAIKCSSKLIAVSVVIQVVVGTAIMFLAAKYIVQYLT